MPSRHHQGNAGGCDATMPLACRARAAAAKGEGGRGEGLGGARGAPHMSTRARTRLAFPPNASPRSPRMRFHRLVLNGSMVSLTRCSSGLADTESDTAIPLPNVESPILSKVIEYCTWHVKAESDRTPEDAKNEWNQKFVDVDQGTLFHLILVRAPPSESAPRPLAPRRPPAAASREASIPRARTGRRGC